MNNSENEFITLIADAKAGVGAAAIAIVDRWTPIVRRVARAKLSDPTIRQRVDEDDICQTVFGLFFSGLREGRFIIDSPEDLDRLLTNIARKQVYKQIERHHAFKRDTRKQSDMGDEYFDPMGDESTASVKVSRAEMVTRFLDCLTEEEQTIVEQRRLGRSWEELGKEYNTTADALRVRIGRVTRAAWEKLGIRQDS